MLSNINSLRDVFELFSEGMPHVNSVQQESLCLSTELTCFLHLAMNMANQLT